jgi:hypothetical protein
VPREVVDLHLHTSYSDGLHPPAEVLRLAKESGVQVLAITDHDTVAGLVEAGAEAERLGIRLVPALELSVEFRGQDLHILGYFIDPEDPDLTGMLERQRAERGERMRKILRRLRLLGMPLSEAEVVRRTRPGGPVGRPHIADALVGRGWIETYMDAFRYYIGTDCPAYLPGRTPTPEEALAVLRKAGGVPVLAHPGSYRLDGVFERFVPAGLAGIEVFHPRHEPGETARFRALAAQLGLLETGGSDYHGEGRGDALPGSAGIGFEEFARLEASRPNDIDLLRRKHGGHGE